MGIPREWKSRSNHSGTETQRWPSRREEINCTLSSGSALCLRASVVNSSVLQSSPSGSALSGWYLRISLRTVARASPSQRAATSRLPSSCRSTSSSSAGSTASSSFWCRSAGSRAFARLHLLAHPLRDQRPQPLGGRRRAGRGARFGEVFRPQRAAAGHDRRVFQGVAQFADVAGPRPRLQEARASPRAAPRPGSARRTCAGSARPAAGCRRRGRAAAAGGSGRR